MVWLSKKSTELTHSDPKALTGAMAISIAAKHAVLNKNISSFSSKKFLTEIKELSNDKEWLDSIELIKKCLKDSDSVDSFAEKFGQKNAISGYIYHTVPVVIYSWLKNYGNYEKSLTDILKCGGDTDTTGAIIGALAGASCGEKAIPQEWVNDVCEYPRSCGVFQKVADNLISIKNNKQADNVKYFWTALIVRNLFFTAIVLIHGFARLIPVRIRKIVFKVFG